MEQGLCMQYVICPLVTATFLIGLVPAEFRIRFAMIYKCTVKRWGLKPALGSLICEKEKVVC